MTVLVVYHKALLSAPICLLPEPLGCERAVSEFCCHSPAAVFFFYDGLGLSTVSQEELFLPYVAPCLVCGPHSEKTKMCINVS